jgi:cyclic pyranopterin phosphate synthase
MVDVSAKPDTVREATARGRITMTAATLKLIRTGTAAKGDVLTTAQIAGVMAGKRTHDLIPMCHPLPLSAINLTLTPVVKTNSVDIEATVRTTGKTGVEMEALTAVAVAALTVYDMTKSADRGMRITDIGLVRKSGGKSGTFVAE